MSEKSLKRNLYCLLEIRVLDNLFPNCRSVILNERETFDQSEHDTRIGIMDWRYQRYFSRLRRPFPLPRPPLVSLGSPIFFLI